MLALLVSFLLAALPVGTEVDYQLGGAADVPEWVGIVVRDRTAAPAAGRFNVCYVNGFQTQPNARPWWRKHHWGLVLKKNGKPVEDQAWGEWIFDIRTADKRKRLARIVGRWTDGCAADGFDAVEYDNLDSFSRSRGLIKRKQAIRFARLIVADATEAGLPAGQKNLAGFDGTKVGYSFAVAEECGQWRECDAYYDDFGDQVLAIEYTRTGFKRACDQYSEEWAIVRRDLDLTPGGIHRYC